MRMNVNTDLEEQQSEMAELLSQIETLLSELQIEASNQQT